MADIKDGSLRFGPSEWLKLAALMVSVLALFATLGGYIISLRLAVLEAKISVIEVHIQERGIHLTVAEKDQFFVTEQELLLYLQAILDRLSRLESHLEGDNG